ncbi:MAG: helix-turn-helix domain-containing protein, partial [Gemmatimonadales bacterium]
MSSADDWSDPAALGAEAELDVRAPVAVPVTVEERLGQAVLRLRLYRGWSQKDLERASGVDQTTISRFELGRQRGLSSRRLFAMLRALHVGDITVEPPTPRL